MHLRSLLTVALLAAAAPALGQDIGMDLSGGEAPARPAPQPAPAPGPAPAAAPATPAAPTPPAARPAPAPAPRDAHALQRAVFTIILPPGDPVAGLAAAALDAELAKDDRLTPLGDGSAVLYPAPDRAPVEAAQQALVAAMQAYDNLDLDAAVTQGMAAAKDLRDNAPLLDSGAPLAQALASLGGILTVKGEPEKARVAFRRAVLADPGVKLDPNRFPAEDQALLDEVRKSIPQGNGSLTVTSTPTGAAVWIDGTLSGATPLVLDQVPFGTHLVRVRRTGYGSTASFVDVSAEAASWDASLARGPAAEQLDSLAGALQNELDHPSPGPSDVVKLVASLSHADRVVLGRATPAPGAQTRLAAVVFGADGRRMGGSAALLPIALARAPGLAKLGAELAAAATRAPAPAAAVAAQPEAPHGPGFFARVKSKAGELPGPWWAWAGGAAVLAAVGVGVAVAASNTGPPAPPPSSTGLPWPIGGSP